MKLKEYEHLWLIEDFFPVNIVAGFTKPNVFGQLPDDFSYILKDLAKEYSLAFMRQMHSASVNQIKQPGVYTGDSLFTSETDLALIVRTADCLPLIFANNSGTIGVVHLGWRPALAGILKNIPVGLADFKVVAAVGLRKACYQVGAEFKSYSEFLPALNDQFGQLYFDPIVFTKTQLSAQGLADKNFLDLNICSFCAKQDYPSWRRAQTEQRTLTFIIKNK